MASTSVNYRYFCITAWYRGGIFFIAMKLKKTCRSIKIVEKYNADYIAGGSVQNSLRVCQWILQKPNTAIFFGCIGQDKYGEILDERARSNGVDVHYQRTNEAPTGTCGVLITGTHRSLCANLAAANHFTIDHLLTPDKQKLIDNAEFFYISNADRTRIVVLTQGHLPVLLIQEHTIEEFPVERLEPDEIVDTNGAGDAFVGGFLAQYIQKKSLGVCIHSGIWAARQIIKRSGCTFEGTPDFNE
ncbi:unnamed protein product [Ceratitis capitata]|uniref:Adenosine kinase n=1 Tax=Ceratitis capitata TaxID=7213 RepID=A0A811V5I2_CERCA|nr:unnamed protein product [Ceratitis capitata]